MDRSQLLPFYFLAAFSIILTGRLTAEMLLSKPLSPPQALTASGGPGPSFPPTRIPGAGGCRSSHPRPSAGLDLVRLVVLQHGFDYRLATGQPAEVIEILPFNQTVTLRVKDQPPVTLGFAVAAYIFVERQP